MQKPRLILNGGLKFVIGMTIGSSWLPHLSIIRCGCCVRLNLLGVPVFSLTNFGVESYAYAQSHYDF